MFDRFSTDRDPIRFGPTREGGYQMKQMEYTLKVVTNGPMDTAALCGSVADADIEKVAAVEVTNYRVLPNKKIEKQAKP